MMGMGPGMMAGGWLVVGVTILLLLIAAATVVLLTRNPDRHAAIAPPSPRELLAHRFARGEIDDEEYYLRLSALDATSQGTQPQRP